MSEKERPAAVYVITEEAHFQLIELHEHLRLMGRLSANPDSTIPPRAAWWFRRFARNAGRILKATYWSSEVQGQAR